MDIADLEDAAELLAILVARYFATLIRENVPHDVAQLLAMRYQGDMIAQAYQLRRERERDKPDEGDDNAPEVPAA